MPPAFRAESLAAELGPHVSGKRVLWARADRGREVLPRELTQAGAAVEPLIVYRNVDLASLPRRRSLSVLERGELDWIALGSPSIAESLHALCTEAARQSTRTADAPGKYQPRDDGPRHSNSAWPSPPKPPNTPGTACSTQS